MNEFSLHELQKCAEREVALREKVYAKQGWTDKRDRELRMMRAIAAHFEVQAQLGATGDHPHGKLDETDEGGINIAIGSEPDGKTVRIMFGKKVAWIGLPQEQAVQFAMTILKHARMTGVLVMEGGDNAGDSGRSSQGH